MLKPGKLANIIREMKRANFDVMETRWKEERDFTSDGVRIIHTAGDNGQNSVAIQVQKIARCRVEIERYGSRMIEFKVKAEPVDIVIIHIYMPTRNHEEEEVDNIVRQT